jgi:tripartite-type tricarboxylate transporter receptor subunit TctC
VLAPARTPPEVVRQMNEAINAVLRQAEVSQRLAGQGIEIFTGSPEAARAFVEAQVDVWGKVIRDNGIKAD